MENFINDIFNDQGKLIFVLVAFVAVGEFMAGLVLLLNTKKFIATANKTNGEVRSLETFRNKNGKYDVITVSYKDQLGHEHLSRKFNTQHEKYKIGDKAEVLYSKDNPDKVKLNSTLLLYRIPIMLMVAGPVGLIGILGILTMQGVVKIPF